MNNQLKHATISVLLCSFIILLNMDLSYLKTHLIKVVKSTEKREFNKRYEKQGYTVVLPKSTMVPIQKDVYMKIITYIGRKNFGNTMVNNFSDSPKGENCRGSPRIRSP